MSRDINPFGLRMPPQLRASAERSAEQNGRSLNSEIVFQLQRVYADEQVTPAQRKAPRKVRGGGK